MITKLIGVATLFSASTMLVAGPNTLGARSTDAFGSGASLVVAGCGSGDKADDKKAAEAPKDAKKGKAKDASCGKGSCGSKESKGKKEGACGKDKKEGSCAKEPKK